jgi:hypothetical protein
MQDTRAHNAHSPRWQHCEGTPTPRATAQLVAPAPGLAAEKESDQGKSHVKKALILPAPAQALTRSQVFASVCPRLIVHMTIIRKLRIRRIRVCNTSIRI